MRKADKRKNTKDKVRIRVVRLNEEEEERGGITPKERSGSRNTELAIVTWLFSALFVLLSGYMIWFNVSSIRRELNTNIYNTKQDTASDRVIRGPIVTEGGIVLASTSVDYSGNEVRSYPYANVFAHTVGYATNGRAGLEAECSNLLMTSHSSLLEQIRNVKNSRKAPGDTVVVTLDPKLQEAAYYALDSFNGAVVVMEPDSGRILAMVSRPDFDPNMIPYIWDDLVSDEYSSALLNRASQGLYPPGSTFKILTALGYLREHGGDPDGFSYECDGDEEREDVRITCYDDAVHGPETLRSAFANSCNTAFASIGLELENAAFRKLCEDFLFNHSLPVDFPCSDSVFALKKDSSEGDQMTTAIGQGDTLVTPLHMAMITSAVANSGVMMKPYMISRVESSEKTIVQETRPEIFREVMTVDEAETMSGLMRAVVTEGTAMSLSWNDYTVAGKTGSAEYEADGVTGTHSWFTGFSNVEDPDIVVTVIAEDGGTGSSTAIPVAQQIFDTYYYG